MYYTNADKVRHFDKIQFKLNLGKAVYSDKGNPSLSSQNNNIIILEEGHDEVGIPFQLEDRQADHLDNLGIRIVRITKVKRYIHLIWK